MALRTMWRKRKSKGRKGKKGGDNYKGKGKSKGKGKQGDYNKGKRKGHNKGGKGNYDQGSSWSTSWNYQGGSPQKKTRKRKRKRRKIYFSMAYLQKGWTRGNQLLVQEYYVYDSRYWFRYYWSYLKSGQDPSSWPFLGTHTSPTIKTMKSTGAVKRVLCN